MAKFRQKKSMESIVFFGKFCLIAGVGMIHMKI